MQRISVQLEDAEKEALARAARLNARSTSAEAALRLRMSLQHDRLGGIAAFSSGVLTEPGLPAEPVAKEAARVATAPGSASAFREAAATPDPPAAASPSAPLAPRAAPPGNPPWYPTSDDLSKPRERVVKSAADLAAELGAKLGSDVPARDFSKGKQAGRAKT